MRKLILKSPTRKAEMEPRRSGGPKSLEKSTSLTSKIFLSPEPRRIGTERRKLNLTASSFFSPTRSPPEIVAPERDIPGRSARDWKNLLRLPFLNSELYLIQYISERIFQKTTSRGYQE